MFPFCRFPDDTEPGGAAPEKKYESTEENSHNNPVYFTATSNKAMEEESAVEKQPMSMHELTTEL